MSNQSSPIPPVLETAWKRFADFDNTALAQQDQYYLLRRWVLYFSIIATFLAIVLDNFRTRFPDPIITSIQIVLILVPIIGSVMVAFLSKFQQGHKYLAMRAGAEEILKELYMYRTVMQIRPNRNKWLIGRVAEVQRQVHRTLGGDVVVKPYTGDHLNPNYYPDSFDADEGVVDLDGDEYVRVRLEGQLMWHIDRIQKFQKKRMRFTIAILVIGGLGALFAGLDTVFNGLAIWVALTMAISTAITNWQELVGVDSIIPNYSKVILELNILRDHWTMLTLQERTQSEFFKLVRSTERVLWSQNIQFISAMKESMEEAEAEQEKIIGDAIDMSQEVVGQVQDEILEEARLSMEEAARAAAEAAASQPMVDEQRLPPGTIFNAALGPAQAVIIGDDKKDAPDGFDDVKNTSTIETSSTVVDEREEPDESIQNGDDSISDNEAET